MSDVPEGYRMSEVGVIPEDWTVNTLENVCVKKGLVRGPFGGALKKEFFVREGIKVYEQKNAIYRNVALGNYFIDKNKFTELKRFEVKNGDFILSCSGTIGKICQIPKGAECGIINQALLKIKTDDNIIYDKFFFYYFDWEKFQEKIIDNIQGGAMQNLVGMDIFRNTQIPLPPLPEQQAIASALRDVDALITALGQLITKKRNIKQGAMQQLPTGEKRLPGFGGAWEVKTLENITTEIGDGIHSTPQYVLYSDFFFVNGNNLIDNSIKITDNTMCVSEIEYNIHTKKLNQRTILLSINGTIGNIAFFNDEKVILGKSAAYINVNNSASRSFIFYLLQSSSIKNYFEDELTGSTIRNLSLKTIRNTPILLPPLPEQQAIAQILSDMDAEIEALKQKRNKYKAIKQGMMQELLTGKTRLVKEDKT